MIRVASNRIAVRSVAPQLVFDKNSLELLYVYCFLPRIST